MLQLQPRFFALFSEVTRLRVSLYACSPMGSKWGCLRAAARKSEIWDTMGYRKLTSYELVRVREDSMGGVICARTMGVGCYDCMHRC